MSTYLLSIQFLDFSVPSRYEVPMGCTHQFLKIYIKLGVLLNFFVFTPGFTTYFYDSILKKTLYTFTHLMYTVAKINFELNPNDAINAFKNFLDRGQFRALRPRDNSSSISKMAEIQKSQNFAI